ncbi:Tagatose 1,6-diphosphate aldolase 2 [compost metagenome]
MFQKTIAFASKSGANFNGVLCGRATWAEGTKIYANQGPEAAQAWLRTQGRENLEMLNSLLNKGAKPLK